MTQIYSFDKIYILQIEQDAVGYGRLRPRCRQLAISTNQSCLTSDWCRLANWTKHTCRLWFWPILFIIWNMTSFTVHNVSHCPQRKTEPRPQVMCVNNFGEISMFFEISKRTDRQTRHTCMLITILCTFTGRGQSNDWRVIDVTVRTLFKSRMNVKRTLF